MSDNIRKRYDPKTKSDALALYLCSSLGFSEMSEKLGVPMETLRTWCKRDNWVQKRREIQRSMDDETESRCEDLIRRSRTEVVRRHLELAQAIDAAIDKKLSGELDPESIVKLARAFFSSARVAARVLGLDANARTAEQTFRNQIVQINLHPRTREEVAGRDTDWRKGDQCPMLGEPE